MLWVLQPVTVLFHAVLRLGQAVRAAVQGAVQGAAGGGQRDQRQGGGEGESRGPKGTSVKAGGGRDVVGPANSRQQGQQAQAQQAAQEHRLQNNHTAGNLDVTASSSSDGSGNGSDEGGGGEPLGSMLVVSKLSRYEGVVALLA